MKNLKPELFLRAANCVVEPSFSAHVGCMVMLLARKLGICGLGFVLWALIIRIGFSAPLDYKFKKEPCGITVVI